MGVDGDFDSYRERKFYMHLKRGYRRAALGLLRYHCRRWNANHSGDELALTTWLVYMRDVTLPNNKRTPTKRVPLASHRCAD